MAKYTLRRSYYQGGMKALRAGETVEITDEREAKRLLERQVIAKPAPTKAKAGTK